MESWAQQQVAGMSEQAQPSWADIDTSHQVNALFWRLLCSQQTGDNYAYRLNMQEPGHQHINLLNLAKQLADLPAKQPVASVLEGCTLHRKQIMRYTSC